MMPLITREELAGLARATPRLAAFAASGMRVFTPPGRLRSGLVGLAMASAAASGVLAGDIARPVRESADSGGFGVHQLVPMPPPQPVLDQPLQAPVDRSEMQAALARELTRQIIGASTQDRPSGPAAPRAAVSPPARMAAASEGLPVPPPLPALASPSPVHSEPASDAEAPVPASLLRAVSRASRSTGLDAASLLTLAWMETRMADHARNPLSSAVGPFQFLRVAWFETVMRFGSEHGLGGLSARIQKQPDGSLVVDRHVRKALMALRDDVGASSLMAAAALASARPSIEAATHRPMVLADMYLAHLLGTTGAIKFLTAVRDHGSVPCSAVIPEAIDGNWNLFARDGRVLSVAAAYEGVQQMVESRRASYAHLFAAHSVVQAQAYPSGHRDEVEVASASPAGPGFR